MQASEQWVPVDYPPRNFGLLGSHARDLVCARAILCQIVSAKGNETVATDDCGSVNVSRNAPADLTGAKEPAEDCHASQSTRH